jgi:hypothetical protein
MSGRVTSVKDFPIRVLLAAMFWEFPPVRYACVQEIAATPHPQSAAQTIFILYYGRYFYFVIRQSYLHDLIHLLVQFTIIYKLKTKNKKTRLFCFSSNYSPPEY